MNNSHDEIRNLLNASRKMLSNSLVNEDIDSIRQQYNIITEQESDVSSGDITKKFDVTKSVEDTIEDDNESKDDKTQGYRISGGILVLHGKEQTDLELTTDEKVAFQETMDEFIAEVSDLVDFNKLNIYPNNVEWSGKLIDYDVDFFLSIGEESGIYINGEMIKADDEFLEMINKLKTFYEKFKSKWAKILASRKKTIKT
jgi:hypothetical protein